MKKLYLIEIKKPIWEKYFSSISCSKEYGNMHGIGTGGESKEDTINTIKHIIKDWEGYDSIVGRISDKVTKKNTEFVSFDDSITLTDLLCENQQKLF